jgi:hypothetical protein
MRAKPALRIFGRRAGRAATELVISNLTDAVAEGLVVDARNR